MKARKPQQSVISPGVYQAVCQGVIDLGTHYNERFKKESHNVLISWELPDETYEYNGETLTAMISRSYTLSLHDKAQLRKDLEVWLGRKLTAQELDEGYELHELIGLNCMLQIGNEEKNGREIAVIKAIMSLGKGMSEKRLARQPIYFSFDQTSEVEEIPKLPDWITKIIETSQEYENILHGLPAYGEKPSAPAEFPEPTGDLEPF